MPDDAEPTPRTRRPSNHLPAEDAGTIARLAATRRAFKDALKREREKTAQLKRDLDLSNAKVVELQPLADGSKAKELHAQLLTLKHRGRFDAIAAESGVKAGAALEDLWAGSGYKAEADQVDEDAIRQAITAQKAARPYLFGEATAEASTAEVKLPAGPGANRGGSTTTPPARFTDDQLSDPAFVMRNWDANVQQAQDVLARGMGR